MKDSCDACHEQLDAGAHRFAFVEEGGDLCFECHDEHEGKVQHPPAEKGECTVCHDPHAGDVKGLLRAASVAEVCMECHEETIEDLAFLHGPVAAGECTACHDPHASDHAKLLVAGGPDVCLKCHDAMRTRITEKKHVHPPAKEDCTACHGVHGGDNFRMLIEMFPAGFYASYDEERYALCFDCHDVELVEEEETDEATNFRNGERNLHYLHVNRKVKGRTCRACHDLHASSQPKLITDQVPFGQWRLPISFEQTPSGGSCQPGCHRRYRYDREDPVVNVPKPKPSQ